jgi:hypothetical protein
MGWILPQDNLADAFFYNDFRGLAGRTAIEGISEFQYLGD